MFLTLLPKYQPPCVIGTGVCFVRAIYCRFKRAHLFHVYGGISAMPAAGAAEAGGAVGAWRARAAASACARVNVPRRWNLGADYRGASHVARGHCVGWLIWCGHAPVGPPNGRFLCERYGDVTAGLASAAVAPVVSELWSM